MEDARRGAPKVPGRLVTCLLVLGAIGLVVWVRLLPLSLAGTPPADRPLLTHKAEDGREHVYLAGYDSYFWLRAARNRLHTGTLCDAITDGQCRDTHTLAPVGGRMEYRHSPHVLAIAAVHRVATFFNPGQPLPSSAYLVPVLVGMLAVLPAFAIGRRLAGDVGGLSAALLIGLNPTFLLRSGTSDNDVWNVFVPLCLFWAVLGSVAAHKSWQRAAYALAAVLFVALHALTWRGWIFSAAVAFIGLLAHLAVQGLRLVAKKSGTRARRGEVRNAVVLAACLLGGLLLFARAAGVSLFVELARLRDGQPIFAAKGGAAAYWPDPFATVGELSRPDLQTIAGLSGGLATFFVAWLGLLLLFLPRRGWRVQHFVVLIAGNYLYASLLQYGSPGRLTLIGLFLLPLVAALVLYVVDARPVSSGKSGGMPGAHRSNRARRVSGGTNADDSVGLFVVVWFLASLFLAFDGNRFLVLLIPPVGIAFGVAIGRAYEWLAVLGERARLPARVADPLLLALVVLLLVPPIRQARARALEMRPRLNDAWWDALVRIRDEAPAEAIVSTWWPNGYWAAYGARRRVSADGGSLPSHVPYWLARSFLSPSEQETVGLLRMLACASDANTWPEREAGAYYQIVAAGQDDLAARALIVQLATQSRALARATLREQKIPENKQAGILEATHCQPPPAYLVLSTEMVTVPGWKLLGNWRFERAYVANAVTGRAADDAVRDISARLGIPLEEARTLQERAARLTSPSAVRDFVSPPLAFVGNDWVTCGTDGTETLCPLPASGNQAGTPTEFVYVSSTPVAGRLRWKGPGGATKREVPAEILVAGAHDLESVTFPTTGRPGLAVLVDVRGRRALFGSPELLRSTFTQLMFLDGRFMAQFEKWDERIGYAGERVVTWRVRWQDPSR